jgi:hypothetical protein
MTAISAPKTVARFVEGCAKPYTAHAYGRQASLLRLVTSSMAHLSPLDPAQRKIHLEVAGKLACGQIHLLDGRQASHEPEFAHYLRQVSLALHFHSVLPDGPSNKPHVLAGLITRDRSDAAARPKQRERVLPSVGQSPIKLYASGERYFVAIPFQGKARTYELHGALRAHAMLFLANRARA